MFILRLLLPYFNAFFQVFSPLLLSFIGFLLLLENMVRLRWGGGGADADVETLSNPPYRFSHHRHPPSSSVVLLPLTRHGPGSSTGTDVHALCLKPLGALVGGSVSYWEGVFWRLGLTFSSGSSSDSDSSSVLGDYRMGSRNFKVKDSDRNPQPLKAERYS